MKNVLIVDDEKSLLLSMKAGFESFKEQFNVLLAENGKEAVSVLEANEVELVITDLKMPVMDGFDLLAYINTNFPSISTMVMTAFGTPEIEMQLKGMNTLKVLEKPVDFDELALTIKENLRQERKDGTLEGISLPNFLQLIEMEQKTCLLEVIGEDQTKGFIYFKEGEPFDALCRDLKGEDAVYEMLAMGRVKINFKELPKKKIKKRIKAGLMFMIVEGTRRLDESDMPEESDGPKETQAVASEPDVDENEGIPASAVSTSTAEDPEKDAETSAMEVDQQASEQDKPMKGVKKMGKIEDVLEKFKDVEGFNAVGVFSPNGEIAAQVNATGVKIDELGALANDVLLKSQKATEIMGVGRGQLVHIEAPKAHIIARCLNEATDFAASTEGRAHVHMVLTISKEGNLAMAKMKLESIIQEVAPMFR